MTQSYFGEQWKTIDLDFEHVNENRIEVSNYGRLRSFNKRSNGNIIRTSTINGYKIIRLKFFKPRDQETDRKLRVAQDQQLQLTRNIKRMKSGNESEEEISKAEKLSITSKKKLSRQFAQAAKERTIYYHSLIHRLVATCFLQPPSDGQTVVAHIDHDKLNNSAGNLKWMTREENYKHQRNSPHVIKERQRRKDIHPETTKLTVTKVMLLKKMLNQGKPMKQLVKQFKITNTQIVRIKRGENWAYIEAAN